MRLLLNAYVIVCILCLLSGAASYLTPKLQAHILAEAKNDPHSKLYIPRDNTTFDKIQFPAIMYDRQLQLQKLDDTFYEHKYLSQSFDKKLNSSDSFFSTSNQIALQLEPFGFSIRNHFLFTCTFPSSCHYTFVGDTLHIPYVAFPHPCLSNDSAHAKIVLKNENAADKTIYIRLFYQNTSYWYPTNDSLGKNDSLSKSNFYGCSPRLKVILKPYEIKTVFIPYTIGPDPKNMYKHTISKWRESARPGNYEFMALENEDTSDLLLKNNIDLKKINPFAIVQQNKNLSNSLYTKMAYVSPQHFKLVFLDEDFKGENDYAVDHVYQIKDRVQKKLCDTCNGNWFKDVISDRWTDDDFNKGYIAKARSIQVEYGNRKENVIVKNGICELKIPGSTNKKKQKTWGEILFFPAFTYGHITARIKFAQMFNAGGKPNGIIHNFWLYQRDYNSMPPIMTNPYKYFVNGNGNQPFEIDFEIWSSISYRPKTIWDDKALINYSVVDYMRDANVKIKPGDQKIVNGYLMDRLNGRQLNIPGMQFENTFFNYYHLYEIYWTPTSIAYLLDGKQVALITRNEAKIPDKPLYLWIGSPIYQDGTYNAQPQIPFLPYDEETDIDWIRIE
jgi:hypothetical protein